MCEEKPPVWTDTCSFIRKHIFRSPAGAAAEVRPAFTRIYLARAHLTIYEQILIIVVPGQISRGDGDATVDYKPSPGGGRAESAETRLHTASRWWRSVHSPWILKFSNFDIDTFYTLSPPCIFLEIRDCCEYNFWLDEFYMKTTCKDS